MFIADRVGEKDRRFARERKSNRGVTADCREVSRDPWGRSLRFCHGHGALRFEYCVREVVVGNTILLQAEPPQHFFVFGGHARVEQANSGAAIEAEAKAVPRLACKTAAAMHNCAGEDMLLFSVNGLEYNPFLADPGQPWQCPIWLVDEILVTTLARGAREYPDIGPA